MAAAFQKFKLPVDGDDEESLEERRGRTVLRTAMLSTLANRYYGPPDGSQPEFDLFVGQAFQPDRFRQAGKPDLRLETRIVSATSAGDCSRTDVLCHPEPREGSRSSGEDSSLRSE
jgi:hypothetical protein